MMKTFLCVLLVLFTSSQLQGIRVPPKIPEVTFNDLKLIVKGEKSSDLLRIDPSKKISCFGVRFEEQEGVQNSMNDLKASAPRCFRGIKGLSEVQMLDGATRQIFATEEREYPDCISLPMHHLSNVFDQIELEVVKLIQGGDDRPFQYQVGEKAFNLSDAPRKDHVNVYHHRFGPERDSKSFMVPFHRDNGLFLILTPFPDHPLTIKLENGNTISTKHLVPSTILVLMGLGTTDWLFQGVEHPDFWATPHAVPSMDPRIKNRTVYARMKVVPNEAIPILPVGDRSQKFLTFDQVFKRTVPDSSRKMFSSETETVFDNWTRVMEQSCEEGSAYCWMGCLSVPDDCDSTEDNLTCVTAAQDPCFADSMNPSCHWECSKAVKLKQNVPNEDLFCRGATDMLMGGFEASGNNGFCIILFIRYWTLNTRWKFACGCLVTMFLGFLIEFMIYLRRRVSRKVHGKYRKLCMIGCFGVNLFLGYLAMLVVMTYSLELFLCTIFGIIIGHFVFNIQEPVTQSIDPCCAAHEDHLSLSLYHVEIDQSDHQKKCCSSSNPAISN